MFNSLKSQTIFREDLHKGFRIKYYNLKHTKKSDTTTTIYYRLSYGKKYHNLIIVAAIA